MSAFFCAPELAVWLETWHLLLNMPSSNPNAAEWLSEGILFLSFSFFSKSSFSERPQITSIIASANPVQRGQATTLTCSAKRSSSSQLVFKWRFKGETLPGSTRTDFTSSLTLPAAREDEDGVYSCEVSDPAGNKASQTVLLNVYCESIAMRYAPRHVLI